MTENHLGSLYLGKITFYHTSPSEAGAPKDTSELSSDPLLLAVSKVNM